MTEAQEWEVLFWFTSATMLVCFSMVVCMVWDSIKYSSWIDDLADRLCGLRERRRGQRNDW